MLVTPPVFRGVFGCGCVLGVGYSARVGGVGGVFRGGGGPSKQCIFRDVCLADCPSLPGF